MNNEGISICEIVMSKNHLAIFRGSSEANAN